MDTIFITNMKTADAQCILAVHEASVPGVSCPSPQGTRFIRDFCLAMQKLLAPWKVGTQGLDLDTTRLVHEVYIVQSMVMMQYHGNATESQNI